MRYARKGQAVLALVKRSDAVSPIVQGSDIVSVTFGGDYSSGLNQSMP
jgi:hypothetical protein